jgi:hypothetical protein
MNKKITDYLNLRRSVSALQGARRAGKTYTIMQWLLLNAYNAGDVCVVVSMTAEQGRTGAYEDANTILRSWGAFGELFEVGKSPRRIVCKRTNTTSGRQGVLEFTAYDDPERGKGIACDWIYMNEANKFTRQQYIDAAANARKGVILDYNPNRRFWVEDELKPEDILKVSWKDNAKHLTEAQLKWFAKLKENAERDGATATDRYFYDVYYCNKYSDLAGDIFTPVVIRTCKPEEVPFAELRNPVVFGDPSALAGRDYFPLTLSAVSADGTIYILDANSTNEGTRDERCKVIERMMQRLDGVRVYIESNGLGAFFIEYARGENPYEKPQRPLQIEGWKSMGEKFDRILGAYETIRDRVVFVEQPLLPEYLKQVYEFARKCEHDDNIDNIASVCRLHNFLAN